VRLRQCWRYTVCTLEMVRRWHNAAGARGAVLDEEATLVLLEREALEAKAMAELCVVNVVNIDNASKTARRG
jgi:hypothetical protein